MAAWLEEEQKTGALQERESVWEHQGKDRVRVREMFCIYVSECCRSIAVTVAAAGRWGKYVIRSPCHIVNIFPLCFPFLSFCRFLSFCIFLFFRRHSVIFALTQTHLFSTLHTLMLGQVQVLCSVTTFFFILSKSHTYTHTHTHLFYYPCVDLALM